MSRRYKVREIAQQAGLSEATVDRVLHHRPNVRSRFHFRETFGAYLTNEWLGDAS